MQYLLLSLLFHRCPVGYGEAWGGRCVATLRKEKWSLSCLRGGFLHLKLPCADCKPTVFPNKVLTVSPSLPGQSALWHYDAALESLGRQLLTLPSHWLLLMLPLWLGGLCVPRLCSSGPCLTLRRRPSKGLRIVKGSFVQVLFICGVSMQSLHLSLLFGAFHLPWALQVPGD